MQVIRECINWKNTTILFKINLKRFNVIFLKRRIVVCYGASYRTFILSSPKIIRAEKNIITLPYSEYKLFALQVIQPFIERALRDTIQEFLF